MVLMDEAKLSISLCLPTRGPLYTLFSLPELLFPPRPLALIIHIHTSDLNSNITFFGVITYRSFYSIHYILKLHD